LFDPPLRPALLRVSESTTSATISCEGELVRQIDTTTLLNPRNFKALGMDSAKDV
jgi:hypothetical protein